MACPSKEKSHVGRNKNKGEPGKGIGREHGPGMKSSIVRGSGTTEPSCDLHGHQNTGACPKGRSWLYATCPGRLRASVTVGGIGEVKATKAWLGIRSGTGMFEAPATVNCFPESESLQTAGTVACRDTWLLFQITMEVSASTVRHHEVNVRSCPLLACVRRLCMSVRI